ncbi:MAG: hypothetical protein ACQEVT_13880 [Pseudomonadota bacterium]|uniref:hypothetical protein n=1 Tax=Roseovarius TaxID=74030 RepID=UPI0022A823EC|nr:hypothetical protein [Roseovarius sp. EGI FJ00037]MCZ0813450.1 hypothetical protein [Roseovarius sp. EGI FJ00037]
MLHRKFIAAILASAIAITGMTAAPARADNDAAKIIVGAAALALIGAAVADARQSGNHSVYRNQRSYAPKRVYRPAPVNRAAIIPHRRVQSPYHQARHQGYQQRSASGSRVALPNACLMRANGQRSVYNAHCLRRHGYR